MNSTSVIIGAMLISPLMGPINGLGYGIATYNLVLFRRALKNFAFAVGAGLVTSTLYFAVTPVSAAHSEILARTTPTTYDVLIALFGGMAGILAISSKQKGNVLPGVAIATALMPPLCTAGYGLASGQIYYFFGAFYLFIINAVFIAISSVIISRILKFPHKSFVEEAKKRRVHRLVTAVIILTIIPSIYLGYGLVQNERFNEKSNRFIKSLSSVDGSYLLKSEIKPIKRTIVLVFGGVELSEKNKKLLKQNAAIYGLNDVTLDIQQGFSYKELAAGLTETERLKSQSNQLLIDLLTLQKKSDSLRNRKLLGRQLLKELQFFYPSVKHCAFSETTEYMKGDTTGREVFIVTLGYNNIPARGDIAKIDLWLKNRLDKEHIKIYHEK
jgi:uncharacterized hydrophobic protein (TIGR00271 family)